MQKCRSTPLNLTVLRFAVEMFINAGLGVGFIPLICETRILHSVALHLYYLINQGLVCGDEIKPNLCQSDTMRYLNPCYKFQVFPQKVMRNSKVTKCPCLWLITLLYVLIINTTILNVLRTEHTISTHLYTQGLLCSPSDMFFKKKKFNLIHKTTQQVKNKI